MGAVVEGGHVWGTIGRANELHLLVNQEARATTGCFRLTNLGALSMESGLRAASTQPESRQRRLGPRLLSMPQGDQAREIVGAPTAIGRRFANALAYAGGMEISIPLQEPKTLDADLLQEGEAEPRPKQRRVGLDSPCSRTGRDWTTGLPATQWFRGMDNPGWASKLTWATTRRHMMQSALLPQGRWNRLHEDRLRRSGSLSLRTHKQPTDEWPRRSRAPASSTRSRQGNTSPHCEGPAGNHH